MIKIQLEYDIDGKIDVDNEWIHEIFQNIFNDNHHQHGKVTLIISDDENINTNDNTPELPLYARL